MNIPNCDYFFVDIDGTLTDYKKGVFSPENTLHGNFLFPILRDIMIEKGWAKNEAEAAILKLTQTIIFWDYTDIIAQFQLPVADAFQRMRQWHRENIVPCPDGIALVKKLHQAGKKLFVMSNNPYVGCLLKLQVAGLAEDEFSSPYFSRILGTNVLRGCKCAPAVWQRAMAQVPADPSNICIIGDNPVEDGAMPASQGLAHHIILERNSIAHGVENTGK